MPNNTGLNGLLKLITDITKSVAKAKRTANRVKRAGTVKRAGQNIKKAVGGGGKKPDVRPLPQTQPQNQANAVSWVCACGVTNTGKFCGGCGKPAPAELICPQCRWVRPPESSNLKFCGNCGARLEE
jgi:NADH pyrophosphatase NudC (nudix superfamily)